MKLDIVFKETNQLFAVHFGEVHNISDGGYERGYDEGYVDGETVARIEAKVHNAEILTDCNAVLPNKGAQTANTLEQVPQRIGEIKSYDEGYDAGVEDGKQAEYDRFCDGYQQDGDRTDYRFAYAGTGWTDETFKPKYPLRIAGNAECTFTRSAISAIPVELDTSQCTDLYNTFAFCNNLVRLPRLDISKVQSSSFTFRECYSLEEIACLVFSENTKVEHNMFFNTSNLKHLTVEGTINTTISLHHCSVLNNESVQSIIDHLKDLTGATAKTLTLHADVGNKLTQAQKDAISAKNWTLVY